MSKISLIKSEKGKSNGNEMLMFPCWRLDNDTRWRYKDITWFLSIYRANWYLRYCRLILAIQIRFIWPPALLYGRRSLAFGPRPSCSDIFMVFLSFKTGYLIYLFITWNNSIIGSALIIIYDEYYEPKSKIKAHELVTFTRARKTNKNNLTYLFHAKTWLDLFFNISH